MTDILCRWLNEELRLSQVVEPQNLAKIFSNGYLIGEVLHKYQVQNDFSMFTEKSTSISKLNNFTRLEPSLHLLGISFDINIAQALMQEKPGVATRLLYQLYFSLERKRRIQMSGTVMEITQPAAIVGLHKKEHEIYYDRLHQVVKRDAELKLHKISQHYEGRLQQWTDRPAVSMSITIPSHKKRQLKVQDVQKVKSKKVNAEKFQVPKPPPYTSQLSLKRKQQQRAQQAQKVQAEIAQFESNKKKLATCGFASSSVSQAFAGDVPLGSSQEFDLPGSGTKLVLKSNCRYIRDIRQRLLENAAAREQREKRLNRFLMAQLKAHEAEEEARRDEQMVKRLTRQTQLEQRLATQLLQMRRQKEVIRENRLFREQQYRQRRERDFQEALDMEAALAQQVKLERPEEIRKELEYCERVAAERVQRRYKRHFAMCRDIAAQIIDLVTMVGEYRLLNENQIPEKQMREWKELLLHGLPLYESTDDQQPEYELSTNPVELEKQEILNNQDYDEYTNMVGEWAWPEEAGEADSPPANNDTLGHVIVRLRNLLHRVVESSLPPLPQFTFKACVVGKLCSGKTSFLARFAKAHEMYILSADTLIEEALNAHRIGEVIVPQKQDSELLSSFTSPSLDFEEEGGGSEIRLTEKQDKEERELLKSSTSLKPDLDPAEGSRSSAVKVTEQRDKADNEQLTLSVASKLDSATKEESGGDEIRVTEQQERGDSELLASSTSPKPGLESEEGSRGVESRLSGRAIHGAAVEKELRKGLAIPNELLVDVIVEAIRQIPAHSSWILDGFPSDVTQAELLRTSLGGTVEKTVVRDRTELVVDPNPPKNPPPAPPVLDLAVLLDIPDECVAQRAHSHTDAAGDTSSHPTDMTLYQAQIPHRITFFYKTWPKLEKWFDKKLNILVRVDADVDEEELYRRVESVLQEAMQQKDEALTIPILEYVVPDLGNTPDSLSTTPSSTDLPPELTDKAAGSAEPAPSLKGEKTPSLKSALKFSKDSPREPPPSSVAIEDSVAVCKSTPESDISFLDPSGLYVIKPLPPDVPEFLSSHWDTMCVTYVDNIKAVMQHLRTQRTEIDLRFYDMRGDYSHYLRRPDLKQEFVSEWQKYFNSSMWDVTRFDEQTKAELHLRLDELCERLWDISEKRKEHGDRERDILMHGGRLEDQAVIMVNHHSILMQMELDRFQATLQILKVYYLSMCKDVLPELSSDILKIALQDAAEICDPHSDSAAKASSKYQDQTGAIKQPNEKFVSDHEETVTAISNLVLAEASKGEKNEEETDKDDKAAGGKKKKAKPPPKKKKGEPTPPPPASDESSEKSSENEVKSRIYKEYEAALKHEENAAKVRMALVRGHSLALVNLLQSRAQHTTGRMQEWLEEHYLAEMKSIDQLLEVVRYHIESAEHLKNEMVLRGTKFFLMDVRRTEEPPALTILQLECLYQGFYHVSQSGLMPSSGIYKVLGEIISVNTENCKVPNIAALLSDESEHIDWRRLLLSAALPWPSPSVPQLLVALESFKAVDTDLTGYVNEEQYLQVELWFSDDDVQTASQEPSDSRRNDHLADLHKFFFKLFADHSSFPPRLHYESMLRYFAADLDPREGFIRALSLELQQHFKGSSQEQLVQSMPSVEEETELDSSALDGDNNEEETQNAVNTSVVQQGVSIPALLAVMRPKVPETPESQSREEQLVQIFEELDYGPEDTVPFSVLCQHPVFQDLMEKSTQHQLVDIHDLLLCCLDGEDEEEQDESDSATSL